MPAAPICEFHPTFGADPELFISLDGRIVGSEKFIPEAGIGAEATNSNYNSYRASYTNGNIVRDGVQVELHPTPTGCRANFCNYLASCIRAVVKEIAAKGATLDFNPVVQVSAEEMASLSEKSRVLGCAPSRNADDPTATISVPSGFNTRSAGGHVQLSEGRGVWLDKPNPETLARVMNIVVGIPGVLMDRNPMAAERRKVYGRAGEFRVRVVEYKPVADWDKDDRTIQIFEYRTLSNFWLHSPALTSFILGLSRLAFTIYHANRSEEFLTNFDTREVVTAINTNDYALAWKQWETLKAWLVEWPITSQSMRPVWFPAMDYFFSRPIAEWWPADPISAWSKLGGAWDRPNKHTQYLDAHFAGWETFVEGVLLPAFAQGREKAA